MIVLCHIICCIFVFIILSSKVHSEMNALGAAMAEGLGQRSVLGLGVLLGWLLLFHLLVNIWLLCVFTSLLVVLGGWLGSQAVLESNSLVHLERFISLKPVSLPLSREGYAPSHSVSCATCDLAFCTRSHKMHMFILFIVDFLIC